MKQIITGVLMIIAAYTLLSCVRRVEPLSRTGLMEGALNFRDMGRYALDDGREVSWRKLFRSSELSSLTDADLAYWRELGIKTVIDFRSDAEVLDRPSRLPEGVKVIRLPIELGNMGATHSLIDLERDAVIALMKTINRRLVRECIPQYRSFLQILLREEAYPLVFHCTAGKDRTGFAGALLLNILGVDSATVMSDYLLSNDFQRPPADLPSNLQPMYHVRREYLEAAFDEITEQYGNMEVYLSIALGCLSESDIKKLRELLTE